MNVIEYFIIFNKNMETSNLERVVERVFTDPQGGMTSVGGYAA